MTPAPKVTTNAVAPGERVAQQNQPCDECLVQGVEHSVQVVGKTHSTSRADRSYFDAAGNNHVHSWGQQAYRYQCSNGHEWAERFIVQCPSCGWTVDQEINASRKDAP